MDKNFKFEEPKESPDNKKIFELDLVRAKTSEYFRYWSDLDAKGFSVVEVKQNQAGLYGVVINNRSDEFPKVAVMGEYMEDPVEAALSSVEKLEKFVSGDYEYKTEANILGLNIKSDDINTHIDQNVKSGWYGSYEGMECIGLSQDYYVDSSRSLEEAQVAIFKEKEFGLIEANALPNDYLKSQKEAKEDYGVEDLAKDFCNNGLSKLHKKKLEYLSKKSADSLKLEFGDVLDNELNVNMKVEAQTSFDKDHDIGYNVRLDHKTYPLHARSEANFTDPKTSYYTARNRMIEEIKDHKSKLEKITNEDKKLAYLLGDIENDFGSGAILSDLSDEKTYKSIKVYVPSFSDNLKTISASGQNWDDIFDELKKRYQETYDYLHKDNDEEEGNSHDANVTGLPTSMVFDVMEGKTPGDRAEILYAHLKIALDTNSQHTKIPPYFSAEKLKFFSDMAVEKEDYELAKKIKDWVSKNY